MSNTVTNSRIKYTDKYLNELLSEEGYQFIGIVVGSSPRRMIVRHKLCGKTYNVRVDKFVSEGQRCSCMRKREGALISNTEDYQNHMDKIHGDGEYTALTSYLGRKKPITIRHSCGHEYEIQRAEYLLDINTGGKCPLCSTGIIFENTIDESDIEPTNYLVKINFKRSGLNYGTITTDVFIENPDGDIEIDGVKFIKDEGRLFTKAEQKEFIKNIENSKLE